MLKKAMILAAGLGTRLRPLTLARPKVLAPLMGVPLLDFWIHRLHRAGVEAVVVNGFHHARQLTEAVNRGPWPVAVEARVEPVLLGTAGGVRNVLDFFDEEPFVVVNGDVICRVNLDVLYRQHLETGAAVSLLVFDHPTVKNVAVDPAGRVVAFREEAFALADRAPEVRLLYFTGIHFLHAGVLRDYPAGRPGDIVEVYRDLAARSEPPRALFIPDLWWRDMGSVAGYWDCHRELAALPAGCLAPLPTGSAVTVHAEARVAADAELRGTIAVGRGTRVGAGARLEDVILWDGVEVEPHSRLRRCIVTDGCRVGGVQERTIVTHDH